MAGNEYAIAFLENRVRVEESCIRSNQKVIDDAKALIKNKAEIERRSAERIAHYERCIAYERERVLVELAQADRNIVDRQKDVERSTEAISSLNVSLAILRSIP